MILQQLYLILQNAIKNEEGQDLIEYALIAMFISLVAIASMAVVGTQVSALYAQIVAAFP